MESTIEFHRGSSRFHLLAKPFWTSHAFRMQGGGIGVARVDACYADRRYKPRVDGLLPDYTSGTLAEGYDGELVPCMIDLSQADLDAIRSHHAYASLRDPD